jgi:hypothetical protein
MTSSGVGGEEMLVGSKAASVYPHEAFERNELSITPTQRDILSTVFVRRP